MVWLVSMQIWVPKCFIQIVFACALIKVPIVFLLTVLIVGLVK